MSEPHRPANVEVMIERIKEKLEKYPDGRVPYEDSIMLTTEVFLDLCERLVALEKKVNGE